MNWNSKYRPQSINEMIKQDANRYLNHLNTLYYHLLFAGPSGTGKSTTCQIIVNKYFQQLNVLKIDGSKQRDQETIRNLIRPFLKTKLLSLENGNKNYHQTATVGTRDHKFIIIEEADGLLKLAQYWIASAMKKYTCENIHFILICNYLDKITDSLKAQCLQFSFYSFSQPDMIQYLLKILNKVDPITYSNNYYNNNKQQQEIPFELNDCLSKISQLADGDCRKAINILQTCHEKNNQQLSLKSVEFYFPMTTRDKTITIFSIMFPEHGKLINFQDFITNPILNQSFIKNLEFSLKEHIEYDFYYFLSNEQTDQFLEQIRLNLVNKSHFLKKCFELTELISNQFMYHSILKICFFSFLYNSIC